MSRNRFDIPALAQARRGQLRVVQCINEIGDCAPLPCRRGKDVITVHRRNCRALVAALLTGGVALGALGVAGTAGAEPSNPGPTIDYSDWGVPVVECIQCRTTLPSNAPIWVNPQIPSVNVGVQSAVR